MAQDTGNQKGGSVEGGAAIIKSAAKTMAILKSMGDKK